MRSLKLVLAIALLLISLIFTPLSIAVAKEGRVSVELITEKNMPAGAQQDWYRAVSALDISGLTIRSGQGTESPDIIELGTEEAPSFKIVGVVTRDDKLHLKGVTITRREVAKLKEYVDKVRLDGAKGPITRRGEFGLSGNEIADLHDDFKKTIDIDTKGKPPAGIVASITKELDTPVIVSEEARRALDKAEPCYDDLRGMAMGAGMAALLRPYGLAIVPERPAGGVVQLQLVVAPEGTSVWPIGWTPEEKEKDLVPMLYEFLNAEIDGFKLADVLDVLSDRLKVKFLLDHNTLAAESIDPATFEVSFPSGRTFYRKVIDRVLSSAKLRAELRSDEAGKVFFWVSSVRPPKVNNEKR